MPAGAIRKRSGPTSPILTWAALSCWRLRRSRCTRRQFRVGSKMMRRTVGLMVLAAAGVCAQQRGGTPQTDKVAPVNTGANPYQVMRDWAQLSIEKRDWGGSNG